jgi:hypothetical protein
VIERDGGAAYCTALMHGPDGHLLGKHRELIGQLRCIHRNIATAFLGRQTYVFI